MHRILELELEQTDNECAFKNRMHRILELELEQTDNERAVF